MLDSEPSNLIHFGPTRRLQRRSAEFPKRELIGSSAETGQASVTSLPASLFQPVPEARTDVDLNRRRAAEGLPPLPTLASLQGSTIELESDEPLPDTALLWDRHRPILTEPSQVITLEYLLEAFRVERPRSTVPWLVNQPKAIRAQRLTNLIVRSQLPSPGPESAFLELPADTLLWLLDGPQVGGSSYVGTNENRQRLFGAGVVLRGLLTATDPISVKHRRQLLERLASSCRPGLGCVAYHVRRIESDSPSAIDVRLSAARTHLLTLLDRPPQS